MNTDNRGEEIRFVRGKYVGCTGWHDISRKKSEKSKFFPVIVTMEDDTEKQTRVRGSSIRVPHKAPLTHKEAAMQQYPDIELAMINLADMFIQCNIESPEETLRMFNNELLASRNRQDALKGKARYRGVYFPSA